MTLRKPERWAAASHAFGADEFTSADLADAFRPLINPMVAARKAIAKREQMAKKRGEPVYAPEVYDSRRKDDVEAGLRIIACSALNNWIRQGLVEPVARGVYRLVDSAHT